MWHSSAVTEGPPGASAIGSRLHCACSSRWCPPGPLAGCCSPEAVARRPECLKLSRHPNHAVSHDWQGRRGLWTVGRWPLSGRKTTRGNRGHASLLVAAASVDVTGAMYLPPSMGMQKDSPPGGRLPRTSWRSTQLGQMDGLRGRRRAHAPIVPGAGCLHPYHITTRASLSGGATGFIA